MTQWEIYSLDARNLNYGKMAIFTKELFSKFLISRDFWVAWGFSLCTVWKTYHSAVQGQ